MNRHTCCKVAHRGGRVAGWVVPGVVLALMPKCPACVVGYVALLTGLGISISAAAYLRTGLIVLCVGLIALLVFRSVYRFVKY